MINFSDSELYGLSSEERALVDKALKLTPPAWVDVADMIEEQSNPRVKKLLRKIMITLAHREEYMSGLDS